MTPLCCLGTDRTDSSANVELSKAANLSPYSGFIVGGKLCDPNKVLPCYVKAGDNIFMLGLDAVIYGIFDVVLDVCMRNPWFVQGLLLHSEPQVPHCTSGDPQDDRVNAEHERVEKLAHTDSALIAKCVHKVYNGSVHAVGGISFAAAAEKDVFGLLGVNGASITTMFNMLCGRLLATAGRIFFGGDDVAKDLDKANEVTGYCPQTNALLNRLTVEELLRLFAKAKGFSGNELEVDVAGKKHTCNLWKLSCALAVLGSPPVLLLDEPSAGMDPMARQGMWNAICWLSQKHGSTVVLSTHSLDEAEALCSRVAIQVAGRLRCIGTPQQLKQQPGAGLEVNLRIKTPSQE